MSANRSKKRKYDSEKSRKKLIQSGIEVFSREGYNGATTRKISRAAGVNESLIHRYFKSKQGLFFSIMKQFHENMIQASPYPAGNTLEEEFTNFFKFRMDFSQKHKKFLRLGLIQAILDKKVRGQMQLLAKNTPGLVTRLTALRIQGKLRSDINLEQLSMLVIGIAFSMSMFTDVMFKFERIETDSILALATRILSKGLEPESLSNGSAVRQGRVAKSSESKRIRSLGIKGAASDFGLKLE